jgi:hypothetical protein
MSVPGMPLGGPLGDALATAGPGAAQKLQQLAAPGADAASKAAALKAEAAQASQSGESAASGEASSAAAEAAATNAARDIASSFSDTTPVGTPAVPCACGACVGSALDGAA